MALEAQRTAAEAECKASEEVAAAARMRRIRDLTLIGVAVFVAVLALVVAIWYFAT